MLCLPVVGLYGGHRWWLYLCSLGLGTCAWIHWPSLGTYEIEFMQWELAQGCIFPWLPSQAAESLISYCSCMGTSFCHAMPATIMGALWCDICKAWNLWFWMIQGRQHWGPPCWIVYGLMDTYGHAMGSIRGWCADYRDWSVSLENMLTIPSNSSNLLPLPCYGTMPVSDWANPLLGGLGCSHFWSSQWWGEIPEVNVL